MDLIVTNYAIGFYRFNPPLVRRLPSQHGVSRGCTCSRRQMGGRFDRLRGRPSDFRSVASYSTGALWFGCHATVVFVYHPYNVGMGKRSIRSVLAN